VQYGVAQSLLVRHVLLSPAAMCNASSYAVPQDAKSDHHFAGPPKVLVTLTHRICGSDDHAAGAQSDLLTKMLGFAFDLAGND